MAHSRTSSCVNHISEIEKIGEAIDAGESVFVLAEGVAAGEFAKDLDRQFSGDFSCAIATYKGSGKNFYKSIAEQFDIPTETGDEKPRSLPMEEQKEEILKNVSEDWLLILPDAKRLTVGICYWLEDLIHSGAMVICIESVRVKKLQMLDLAEVELALPSDRIVREVMETEAKQYNLRLSESEFAALQPLAGRNPRAAKRVIRNEALGLKQEKPEHGEYLDISPLILAALCLLGMMRFIGMATDNRALYIMGGIAMMIGLSIRYLGRLGNRR